MSAIIPIPKQPVSVRVATRADLPFIDRLQKANTKAVGFMPTQQLEGKIEAGFVLIAEEQRSEVRDQRSDGEDGPPLLTSDFRPLTSPLGYVIAQDRYFKRDDVGIIYQVNVVPEARRGLVAATLVRAVFERAAYGCRLFCCWCAQDLEANRFWEAMGFVALAYRCGSKDKSRVHVFWQRRVRAGDATTPYWFPAKTDAGALREDRLVLPIPPGVRWCDEMPMLEAMEEGTKALPHEGKAPRGKSKTLAARVPGMKCGPQTPTVRRVQFAAPGMTPATQEKCEATPPPPKPRREKQKSDPRLVAAARELRDRWLEHVNANPQHAPAIGKYDVARMIEAADARETRRPALLLPHAA